VLILIGSIIHLEFVAAFVFHETALLKLEGTQDSREVTVSCRISG
jgi:hypothetical protein